MKSIDRIDITKKRPIPIGAKMVILLAVIFGIWLRAGWVKKQPYTLHFFNIRAAEVTSSSIEVNFEVSNPNDIEVTKSILIRAFTPKGELIADRITEIVSKPKQKQKYIKMLNILNIPIKSVDDIGDITVEIYTPSFF
jgi:hypothetical protein